MTELVARLRSGDDIDVPPIARQSLLALAAQLECLAHEVHGLDHELMVWHRTNASSQRLGTNSGVGIIAATALAASVPDPGVFKSGREFAAFLSLVPPQNSSVGKDRLGRISKMGNGYLRKLLVVGATSVIRRAKNNDSSTGPCLHALLERKPARVVTVVVANKAARTAWAIFLASGLHQGQRSMHRTNRPDT